ncbi:MAG TPA: hypothetical protein VL418_11535 [Devosiaceae bacterium]|nr:hypothetical protein [Devosiaceae bacterium]
MAILQMTRAAVFTAGMLSIAGTAMAQDEGSKPHVPLQKSIGEVTPTGPVPSLAVINSDGATLTGNRLTLTGVSKNSIVFADRPVRAAGHVATEQFLQQWEPGKNSFDLDPPNATVSVLGGDGSDVNDAVVQLKSPKMEGDDLTFEVSVLEGSLHGAKGPAAVFIDPFRASFGGGGFHGGVGRVGDVDFAHAGGVYHGGSYWHAPAYHGAWYGAGAAATGAVVGAAAVGAAAAPYYGGYPTCGYYPYGPCY